MHLPPIQGVYALAIPLQSTAAGEEPSTCPLLFGVARATHARPHARNHRFRVAPIGNEPNIMAMRPLVGALRRGASVVTMPTGATTGGGPMCKVIRLEVLLSGLAFLSP
jgi:hypothetical protein